MAGPQQQQQHESGSVDAVTRLPWRDITRWIVSALSLFLVPIVLAFGSWSTSALLDLQRQVGLLKSEIQLIKQAQSTADDAFDYLRADTKDIQTSIRRIELMLERIETEQGRKRSQE